MILTTTKVTVCCPNASNIETLTSALNLMLPKYKIETLNQVAAFLAQCGHESTDFTRLEENLNYSAEALRRVWPSRFPSDEISNQYARHPQLIANKVYADRMGNGNEASGDGWKYRGRGAIQLTGCNNYTAFAKYINQPVSDVVDYLSTIQGAIESACWYWTTNNLNTLADKADIIGITKKINGGAIGLKERTDKFNKCLAALK